MSKNVVKHSLVQFTMVGNICLRNQNISNGAKGLYATLWDLPEDWELTYHGLAAKCKDGISAIKTQMHELLAEGYVVVEQQRDESGRMSVNVWNVLNIPAPEEERTPAKTRRKKTPLTEIPLTEKPLTEKPTAENRTQDNKENNEIREEDNIHTHTLNACEPGEKYGWLLEWKREYKNLAEMEGWTRENFRAMYQRCGEDWKQVHLILRQMNNKPTLMKERTDLYVTFLSFLENNKIKPINK